MKIPRIPVPDGVSGRGWEGNGCKTIKDTKKFLENYDSIFANRVPTPGHTRIVYKKSPSLPDRHCQ